MIPNPEPGDYVEIKTEKETYRGVLMPPNIFTGQNIFILKLENGYNIGIKADASQIRVLEKKKGVVKKEYAEKKMKEKYISILGTGGTIASYIDYKTGAVHPAETQEELLISVPELSEKFDISSKIIFSILSEDMKVEYWQKLANQVAEELNNGAIGVIIPHGTDTMHYTAAALAFMIPELSGPVSVVAAQRSSDRPSSDAYINLISAVDLMNTDLGEVVVTMHGSASDSYCEVYRGVRVRKMHTSRRDAFKSINDKPIAKIEDKKVTFLSQYRKKVDKEITVYPKMDQKVAVIYYYPGFDEEHLKMVGEHVNGLVIMGTGLGHVGSHLISTLSELTGAGKLVAMTSQCLYGTVNLNVYSTGRELIKAGVMPLGDMLPETAFVKMMWALGNYDFQTARKVMQTNLVGEVSEIRKLE